MAQPPVVPDRGPNTHALFTGLPESGDLAVFHAIIQANLTPRVRVGHVLNDARVLEAPNGYVVPIAHYHPGVVKDVEVVVGVSKPIRRVLSAYHGALKHENSEGTIKVILPSLEYGDVLRIEKAAP
jgi:hypothetical protein